MGVRIRIRNWLKAQGSPSVGNRAISSSNEEDEDDSFNVRKRERKGTPTGSSSNPGSLKRMRETMSDSNLLYVPETDPRSTSLYQSIATYTSTRTQEGPKRRSGEKAINSQIMKSGGEINFVNKVLTFFPLIKDNNLKPHDLPLDELCERVIKKYPQPWLTSVDVRDRLSRESTPIEPSPRRTLKK